MAVTVTANLTDVDLAETNTNWSDGATFGAAGTALATGDGVFKQGTDSQSARVSKNNSNWIQWIGTAKDMSATDTHLYWWLLTAIRPSMTAMEIRIGSSSTDYSGWTIDAFTSWDGSWKCFVQDLAATPDTTSGTVNLSAITIVSVLFSTVGQNFRAIENVWTDAVRFGTGLTATGTDFDLVDIAADDQLVANQYGILQDIDGVIFSQGRVNIGNGATTTTFNSTNEVLVFRDAAVSATLYELNLVGSGNVTVANDLTLRSAGVTDGTRFYLDASDTAADITINGVAVTRAGLIDFSSTSDIQNFTFNDCLQITPSTGIFKLGTVKNYAGAEGGAVLYPTDDTNFLSISFLNNTDGIEYDAASDGTPNFKGLLFDDLGGQFDVNNTQGASVTIALADGSNANSYNTGGDVVTFSNPKQFIFTLSPTNTAYEWRIYSVTALGSLVGAVELDGEESATVDTQTYNYTYSGDQPIAVQIIDNLSDYIESVTYYTLLNSNQSVTILLQTDDNN